MEIVIDIIFDVFFDVQMNNILVLLVCKLHRKFNSLYEDQYVISCMKVHYSTQFHLILLFDMNIFHNALF